MLQSLDCQACGMGDSLVSARQSGDSSWLSDCNGNASGGNKTRSAGTSFTLVVDTSWRLAVP